MKRGDRVRLHIPNGWADTTVTIIRIRHHRTLIEFDGGARLTVPTTELHTLQHQETP